MLIVEPTVSEEKLRELLAEGHESSQLDYKDTIDLDKTADRVELAKDIGAMSAEGGYLVIGANGHGKPTGSLPKAQLTKLDEANLRKILSKYIPEPVGVRSQHHEIDGKSVAVIYIAPREDGFCVFKADGQYERSAKSKQAPKQVFREGDVFVRHGTSSERWSQNDVQRIRERLRSSERERLRSEIAPLLEQAAAGARAQSLASSAAQTLTWQLDEETFRNVVIELIRRQDLVPLRLFLEAVENEANALIREEGRLDDLRVLLDRLACLAATALTLEEHEWFNRVVKILVRVYDSAFWLLGKPRQMDAPRIWLLIAERIHALGGLAVRRRDVEAVATLATQRGEAEDFEHLNNLLRHGLTMAARAKIFQERQGDEKTEPKLIHLAHKVAVENGCLHSDVGSDDERLLDSLCQFDVLWNLAAIGRSGSTGEGQFYPNFAWYYSKRSSPAVNWFFASDGLRSALFPEDDAFLADAFRELISVASRERGFGVWDGFASEPLTTFLHSHPPRDPPR